ncbi:MAG: tRNA pseudouridine(38-40) synthase TruA [Armatimonadota bacterium]
MSTKRVKLVVSYDGYDFCGWAPQQGQRTVHGTLTEGLRRVSGVEIEITGASRTDSGAHAKGQVCHFDDPHGLPVANFVRALNDVLPYDISVLSAVSVASDFHSRFCAQDRFYRFRILCGPRDPHRARHTWWYGRALDVDLMAKTAQAFEGEHDFVAFSQMVDHRANTVRTIRSISVRQVRDEVWVDVVGTAFVRGMMRRIAGSLFEVGRGYREPENITKLLAQRDRSRIKFPTLLPAHGLCLMRIRYGRHPFDHRQLKDNLDQNERQDNEE